MHAHWFVIASEKTINIFTEVNDRNILKLIKNFENPIPEEASSVPFAKTLIYFLTNEHRLKNFNSLTIAAEPHFLGKIKGQLKPPLNETVKNWIRKDLIKIPLKHLPDHLPLSQSETIKLP